MVRSLAKQQACKKAGSTLHLSQLEMLIFFVASSSMVESLSGQFLYTRHGAAQPWRRRQKSLTQRCCTRAQGGSAVCTSGNALINGEPIRALCSLNSPRQRIFVCILACQPDVDKLPAWSPVNHLLPRSDASFSIFACSTESFYYIKTWMSGTEASRKHFKRLCNADGESNFGPWRHSDPELHNQYP